MMSVFLKLISRLKRKIEIIAINFKTRERLYVLIPFEKANEIRETFHGNFNLMLDKIKMIGNRLVIIAPNEVD